MADENNTPQPIPFRAETRQLLDILIHSLYTEREIFLRELISNASDALTRISFEMLTNREVLDPDAELAIYINFDTENNTLTIRDTGIGMTATELGENLGTIAHSGARDFVSAMKNGEQKISDIIGQFGVGFYSAFMVADKIEVVSRSYQPDSQASVWTCTGEDTFTIQHADQQARGTTITLHLKNDASEFCQEYRLRDVIRRHSEFISFPIYLGEKAEQVNRQTAIWRQLPRKIEKKDYQDFHRQLTLDPTPPLAYTHLSVDAPVQMYAILYIPASSDKGIFSLRKEDGLKLYSRKILIQEYCKDLLPQYFRFIQGVVDSEDLPLNVARESYQSSRVIAQLKSLITSKVVDMLSKLAIDEPDQYTNFWHEFGVYIKEGVATETNQPEDLYPLLRFRTSTHPDDLVSLEDYCQRMVANQQEIYYLLGDDPQSITLSPHLDYLRQRNLEVLLLTEPIDSFMLIRLIKFNDHPLTNIASADFKIPSLETADTSPSSTDLQEEAAPDKWLPVLQLFQTRLGEKVASVRITDRLSDSPARLVDPENSPSSGLQRVYRYLKENYEIPKKILELNPSHPIIISLGNIPPDNALRDLIIDQIFESALLIEGIHPNPAGMIHRIEQIIQAALPE